MTGGLAAVRQPMTWLREVCGGEWAYPLVILFGLNAVDELDRTAFGILLPEIRDHFDLDLGVLLGLVALSGVAALALQVPIAQYADRSRRVRLAAAGALVWACFSGLTGLATTLVILTIARSGSSIGKAVIDPTHNSLLSDYYPIEARNRVFSVHRAANAVGSFVGPLSAGLLAYSFGWRVPFLVFVVPTVIFAVLATRLPEPIRGSWERRAAGATDEVANTEELPPSFAESWRICTRCRRCGGSGGRCRSSPSRWSALSSWRRCSTSRSSTSTNAPAVSPPRSPSRSNSSASSTARASRCATSPPICRG